VVVATVLIATVVLAACSTSATNGSATSHGGTSRTTSSGSSSTSGPATTVTTTSPASTGSSTSTPGGTGPTTTVPTGSTTTSTLPGNYCGVPDLRAAIEGTEGAAGTIEVTFSFTNTSPSTCVLDGYPGAFLLGSRGAPLPTIVKPGGNLSFLDIQPSTVDIAAGASAYFNLGYSDVVADGEMSCPTSSSIEITPPHDTQQLTLAASIEACDGGLLSISPVFGADSPATSTTAPPVR
jgi:hypothetical protein